jgi:hypothetical protein
MEYFGTGAGEVKYFRNLTMIGDDMISVFYCSQAMKPWTKTNEASLKEIEEATKKVKEAHNLVSVAVDP